MSRYPKVVFPREFIDGYIRCALWSSTDNADDGGGEPLDKNYGRADIAPKTLREMMKDCSQFCRANRKDIEASGLSLARAGHDYWLNRNGHGAGFWDEKHRGEEADKALDRLDKASKADGSYDLYIGDDGKIHGQ